MLSQRKKTTPSEGGVNDPWMVCKSDLILPISSMVSTSKSFCSWLSSSAGTKTIPNSIAPKKEKKNQIKWWSQIKILISSIIGVN